MKKTYLAIAAMAFALGSCTQSEDEISLNDNSLDRPTPVNFHSTVLSRVANGNVWESTDVVGISATSNNVEKYSNVKYTVTPDDTPTTATFTVAEEGEAISFTDQQAMSFTAYVPYEATLSNDGTITKNTAISQEGVDFLWAEAKDVQYSTTPTVNFAFQHKMSRIVLNITSDESLSLDGKSVVIGGLKHGGTFNTKTGETTVTAADAADWTIGTYATSLSGFIFPQEVGSLTLSIGETSNILKTNIAIGNGIKFEAGNSYTISATIKQGSIAATISKNTISGWTNITVTKTAFIGVATSVDALSDEAKTAAQWMLNNIDYADYVSISDITDGKVDLSDYKMIWAHFDWKTGGDDGTTNETFDNIVNNAKAQIAAYYAAGGNIFASRDALCFIGDWGVTQDSKPANNIWGGDGIGTLSADAGIYCTNTSHPIFERLTLGENNMLYLRSSGLTNTGRVLQWTTSFGDYQAGLETWRTATGGTQLGVENQDVSNTTVRVAEFASRNNISGKAIAIGDPSFEWNGSTGEGNTYYNNLNQFTKNIISYLSE